MFAPCRSPSLRGEMPGRAEGGTSQMKALMLCILRLELTDSRRLWLSLSDQKNQVPLVSDKL
jgi:hypothetical protein